MAKQTNIDLASSNPQNVDAFGGNKMWTVVKKTSMVPTDPAKYGLTSASSPEDDGINSELNSKALGALNDMEGSIDRLSKANASFLKGELPQDLQDSIKRSAAESSISGGLFGSSARAMTARDLGMSSYQVQQQAMETEKGIQEGRKSLADTAQSFRAWNKTYDRELAELRINAAKQNLSAVEQEKDRAQFNASANLKLFELVANLTSSSQQVAATLSANGSDPSGSMATFKNVIDQLLSMTSGGTKPKPKPKPRVPGSPVVPQE